MGKKTEKRTDEVRETISDQVQRVYDAQKLATIQEDLGKGGSQRLDAVQGILDKTSIAAQNAKRQSEQGSDEEKGAAIIRDTAESLSRGVEGWRKGVDSWTGKKGQEKDAAKKDIDDMKKVIEKNEPQSAKKEEPKAQPSAPAPEAPKDAADSAPPSRNDLPSEPTKAAPESKEGKEETKTHAELLEENMKGALKELKEAKGGVESFAALVKLLGAAGEYLKRAFDGSLSQRPEKLKTEQVAPTEEKAKPDIRKDVIEQLQKETKGKEATPKLPEKMDKAQDEKKQEIVRNESEIKEYDKSIDTIKKENDSLIDGKSRIEQQINNLRGDSKNEPQISRRSLELQRLTEQIDTNQRAIEKLAKQRDDLKARNELLGKETKVLGEMKKDLADALKKIDSYVNDAMQIMRKKQLPQPVLEKPIVEMMPQGPQISLVAPTSMEAMLQPVFKEAATHGITLKFHSSIVTTERITVQQVKK